MIEAGYLYPKNKSPSETKYERLRGMCSGAGENVRYIPVDNGIQQHGEHGGIWLVLCVYQYTGSMAAGGTVYLCMTCEHSIQPPSSELRNARVRVSRARACVRYIIILLYYYIIIILLYYYIYIYPIYPIYPVYPTMVI